jgi:hypothetical protein
VAIARGRRPDPLGRAVKKGETNASTVSENYWPQFRYLLPGEHLHIELWVLRFALGTTGLESRRHTVRLHIGNNAGSPYAHNQIVRFHIIGLFWLWRFS